MNHQSTSRLHSGSRAAVVAAVLALGAVGSAYAADTISISVGPVPLQNVSVDLCVAGTCTRTPPLHSVELDVSADVSGLAGLLPQIVPVACPAGEIGAAVNVTALSSDISVKVKLHGVIAGLLTLDKTVGPVTVHPLTTARISACTL